MGLNIITAKAITKKYGEITAVDNIDFEIRRGECFGFLGPNGAGKTTTMRLLYLASKMTSGSLKIFDTDVHSRFDAYALKEKIGVIPQEDNLDQELTTRETLEVFCRFYGLYGAAGKRRADELLASVFLTEKSTARVQALSGGMRRRLQIARGMIGNPELLILDEPTTGLDPQMRLAIWNHLKELKQKHVTMVLTTHYMHEAEQLCDTIVIMDHGKIIAQGSPRELVKKHVPTNALEVVYDEKLSPKTAWLVDLKKQADYTTELTDRTLLYTNNVDALTGEIKKNYPDAVIYTRHTNLEDVFLRITGRTLES